MEPIRPLGSSIGRTLCAGGPHCEPLRLGVRGLPWQPAVTIGFGLEGWPQNSIYRALRPRFSATQRIYPDAGGSAATARPLRNRRNARPAFVVFNLSLTQIWMPWISRTWLVVRSITAQRTALRCVMSKEAKATPQTTAMYLPESPVSILNATQSTAPPSVLADWLAQLVEARSVRRGRGLVRMKQEAPRRSCRSERTPRAKPFP